MSTFILSHNFYFIFLLLPRHKILFILPFFTINYWCQSFYNLKRQRWNENIPAIRWTWYLHFVFFFLLSIYFLSAYLEIGNIFYILLKGDFKILLILQFAKLIKWLIEQLIWSNYCYFKITTCLINNLSNSTSMVTHWSFLIFS